MSYREWKILKAKGLRKNRKNCDWEKKNENRTLKKISTMKNFCQDRALKRMADVINLEFIIYLMMFQFHFYLSLFHVLYFMNILTCIFCFVCDLGALGAAQKI